jgi:anti-sigma factor RsiW
MCPDPQLLSIYVDGELPSPWNEKMDAHLMDCPACREKFENFKHLSELFNKDASAKKINEPEIQAAKEKIWRNIEAKRRFTPYPAGVWRRRISISIPAAAAAVIIIALITMFISGGGQILNNGFAGKQANPDEKANFILAAEEEIPGIIPAATDLNGVLQYLGADGSDIIILRLPESRNFSRAGEPAIIKAADYSRRHP